MTYLTWTYRAATTYWEVFWMGVFFGNPKCVGYRAGSVKYDLWKYFTPYQRSDETECIVAESSCTTFVCDTYCDLVCVEDCIGWIIQYLKKISIYYLSYKINSTYAIISSNSSRIYWKMPTWSKTSTHTDKRYDQWTYPRMIRRVYQLFNVGTSSSSLIVSKLISLWSFSSFAFFESCVSEKINKFVLYVTV